VNISCQLKRKIREENIVRKRDLDPQPYFVPNKNQYRALIGPGDMTSHDQVGQASAQ